MSGHIYSYLDQDKILACICYNTQRIQT